MRSFIYKVLIISISFVLIFEFTIGRKISSIQNKLDYLLTKEGRKEMVNKVKKEIKVANERENYLDDKERILIKDFIEKIKKELDIKEARN
jgi:hypothetical protein|tara:strand:+ start:1351 stop:1623 length:273 start_codon:yes stop_codon:yes gene_type:complete